MTKPRTLSEHASKELLASYGIPVVREVLAEGPEQAVHAAREIGFPVVVKLCGDAIAHKTERNLVRLDLRDPETVGNAAQEIWARRRSDDGEVGILVAEMVCGHRELIAGVLRDRQFGPCVVLGLGGILTEAIGDVAFGVAPVTHSQARQMIAGLRTSHLLSKPLRGEPAVDTEALAAILVRLGRLAVERPEIYSIDVNPLIVREGAPVAVDGLVVIGQEADRSASDPARRRLGGIDTLEKFRPLFHPRGIIVAGVSKHPGKFGFVAFHNLLRFGYQGEVFPVSRDGGEILGRRTYGDVREVPRNRADLVFVCTPSTVNVALLRSCRQAGVRAAFVASGGYREIGAEGEARERELVETANELGIVLAGPNGQGLISTSLSMCAQIVAPYPPRGRISVVSQSGNISSSLLNYAVLSGVGVSKSISCGNAAQTTLADYLEYFAKDSETGVSVAYLEGVAEGPPFVRAVQAHTRQKPLVVVKGGIVSQGQRAAVSHTGSLATDDRIFDGLCRQFGILRASTVEDAFEWAATLATQPLPGGRRVAVLTAAGGWGVLAADACAAAGLDIVQLPEDVLARIDGMLPARWSRNNPIDLGGGETRDTIPEVIDLLAGHPEFDAVIYLGGGIQAAQAQVFRTGEFYPYFGLDRIVEFHERQDARYGEAARDASERHGKPVMVATELVHTDRAYGNAGPVAVRSGGRICYPSAHHAVRALRALVDYAEYRRSL